MVVACTMIIAKAMASSFDPSTSALPGSSARDDVVHDD
jgi:hypothetical protein